MTFGVKAANAVNVTPLNPEYALSDMTIRRGDFAVKLADGSILAFEFQSSAEDFDVFRFFIYGAETVRRNSDKNIFARVRVIAVYSANVTGSPLRRFPSEAPEDSKFMGLMVEQILLRKLFYMAEFVKKHRAKIEAWEPEMGDFILPEVDIAKMILATQAGIEKESFEELSDVFLNLAIKLSRITKNYDIVMMVLIGCHARGGPLAKKASQIIEKEKKNMDPGFIDFADMITDGNYSLLQKERETLVAENETLAAESKSKDGTIETLAAENEDMRKTSAVRARRAVLALRADNKGVEEISEILSLSLAEVGQILDSVGGNKKPPRRRPGRGHRISREAVAAFSGPSGPGE
ncbi:MAG: hypothetical protein LBO66_14040 [Deltaproteobacteria bacterium]|nr:hypothetical protein [Deltaproteobacteria bacterium]